jgi:polyribonucleotide nucleotidyltransferase
VVSVKVNPERIGEIIGPGGKNIRALQAETNTQISIDDTGLVKIAAFSQEEAAKAQQMVIDIGSDPEIGAVFEGTVVRTTDFGAFVQINQRPRDWSISPNWPTTV